jgi:hypothetical protein
MVTKNGTGRAALWTNKMRAITRLARSFYVFARAWQWNLIRSACVSYQFMKSGEIAVAQTLFKL